MPNNQTTPNPSSSHNHASIMSAVASFKSGIVRIRDILRGPGVAITGMDSMRHICLYVLARYVDAEKAKELGVPAKFAWEELMRVAQTVKGGVQFAFDLFYHKEEDCLIAHFDRLFGTEKFSFDIKNPAKHKEIMEIMTRINVRVTDECMDLLGWVYEQHLGTGSSSASRDLCQYFTDRAICEYMVRMCNPGFEEDGVPESICDPTMGTGGFLTRVIKHYGRTHPDKPIDWKIQCKEIHGCDTDPKVAGIARLNLFMETGGHLADNLLTHDSLYDDLPQSGYKVILANMPFGLKQLVHADCCERVKDLKIRTTKSEPLFLQLMMVSLKLGGRCAVVVPDGMLVNASNGHTGTRKHLLDNFELRRVIKMSGQFFVNTSIQPSILFFENTGNPTTAVEFWDVVRGANGDIQETMVLSVPRANLDAACSFDMRRYQEVKVVANPAGFHMAKLSDIAELCRNNTEIVDDANGMYTKYFGPKIVGKCSNYHFDGEYILTPGRQSIGLLGYVNGKFTTTHTFVIKVKSEYSSKYVYYYLLLNNKLSEKRKGIIPYIKNEDVLTLQVIVPPIEIQQEIVATLDRIYAPGTTELAETIKLTDRAMELVLANPGGASLEPIVEAQRLIRKSAQMVADVKAQMAAVMKSVRSRGFQLKHLSEISLYTNGKTLSSAQKLEGGEYDVMGGGMSYNGKTNKFNREGETISISKSGASAGFVHYHVKKYWAGDCLTIVPKDESCSIKYLYYYIKLNGLTKSTVGSTIPHCKWNDIKNIPVAIPPIDFQQSVISRLDALQSQLVALETLQRQSEDNARFILESYLM